MTGPELDDATLERVASETRKDIAEVRELVLELASAMSSAFRVGSARLENTDQSIWLEATCNGFVIVLGKKNESYWGGIRRAGAETFMTWTNSNATAIEAASKIAADAEAVGLAECLARA